MQHSGLVKRALVLLAVLSTFVIACGADDDDGDDAAAVTTAAVDATGVAGGSTTAAGSTPAGGGSDYCTALVAYKTSRDEFAALVASGTATPEQIQTAITNQGSAFNVLVDAAPSDIAGDLGAISNAMVSLLEALAEVDYDLGSLTTENAAAAEALNELDEPVFFEAVATVDGYNLEHCGITMGDWLVGLR